MAVSIWPWELPEIWIPIMGRLKGIKVEVQRFVLEFGLEIFFQCHKVNHFRILFSVKNLVLASYSRDLAGLKVFWKVSFGHRFSLKIWTFRNFQRRLECAGKHSFWDRIWTQILHFFEGNRESYCRHSFAQQVIKNTDFDYNPIDGRENRRLTLCSQIWLRNIFSISRVLSSENKILVKDCFSGKLFTSLNRYQNT